jgi:hypothetical protein
VHSVLQNESKCWSDFYRYVKRREWNRENIPTIKDPNGGLITDPLEKANSLQLRAGHPGYKINSLGWTVHH